jgi:hypothetical protein
MANRLFDRLGNELWCEHGQVKLRLNGSHRVRFLGTVEGGVFHTYRKESHRFRAMDGIGFNWQLMKHGKFSIVEVQLADGRTLRSTRERILTEGSPLQFKTEGFELQLFVPLTVFESRQKSGQLEETL